MKEGLAWQGPALGMLGKSGALWLRSGLLESKGIRAVVCESSSVGIGSVANAGEHAAMHWTNSMALYSFSASSKRP